jgi:hypothetical protein
MSEILKTFPFKHSRRTIYPYAKWFDGQIHKLVAGKDFTTSPSSMRGTLQVNAWRKGLVLRTTLADDGRAVVCQVTKKNGAKP